MRSLEAVRRQLLAMMILGMATLCFAGPAHPATIVVDRNGGGHYLTIGAGINAAVGGDTVQVLAGVYEEAVVINKSITLVGEGPDTTTIRNPGGNAIVVGVDVNTRISGFEITGSRNGIIVGNRANVVIENNLIIAHGNNGIELPRDGSSAVSVLNNTIVGNGGDGIFFYGRNNLLISNSITVNNAGYGINGVSGITPTFKDCDGLNAVYNDAQGNTSGNSRCTLNTTNISSDPRFVSAATGNYQLRADSPCINAGTPSASASDPDGTRNNMGAWGGPGAAGFWPSANGAPIITDLSVTPGSVPRGGKITIRATGQIK